MELTGGRLGELSCMDPDEDSWPFKVSVDSPFSGEMDRTRKAKKLRKMELRPKRRVETWTSQFRTVRIYGTSSLNSVSFAFASPAHVYKGKSRWPSSWKL